MSKRKKGKYNLKKLWASLKKQEWSKILTGIVAIICGAYAIWAGWKYYQLCELAIMNNSSMPDATLPVTGVTGLLGSILGYLTYQGVLKNSLNKNHLKMESGIVQSISCNDIDDIIDKVKSSVENEFSNSEV